MISPVWLQVKRKPAGTYYMAGTHDIDHEWVREVKKRGKRSGVKSKLINVSIMHVVLMLSLKS